MYSLNNADIYDDKGRADLPLEQTSRRRYTLTLESGGFVHNPVADKMFYTYDDGTVTKFTMGDTVALTYNLPMPLQSRSGFFNVSLRSLSLGQNTQNQIHFDDDDFSFVPVNPNLTVNLTNASSAYNLQVKDDDKVYDAFTFENAAGEPVEVVSQPFSSNTVTKIETLTGPLCPIGTAQINKTVNNPVVTQNLNIPQNYSTQCDSYSVTIPHSAFQSGTITVVLSTSSKIWHNTGTNADTILRTNVPLIVNELADPAGVTIDYNQYLPFNLAYSMVLGLTEA